jgi:hypothetical protein
MKTGLLIVLISCLTYSQMFKFNVQQNIEILKPDTSRSIKEYTDLNCDKENSSCSGVTYKYDTLGRLIEKYEIESDKYNGKTLYQYNINNQLVCDIEYSEENEIQDKNTYKYDSLSRIVEYVDWSNDGKIDRKMVYNYHQDKTYTAIQYDNKNRTECVYDYMSPDEKGKYTLLKISSKNGDVKYRNRHFKYYK